MAHISSVELTPVVTEGDRHRRPDSSQREADGHLDATKEWVKALAATF